MTPSPLELQRRERQKQYDLLVRQHAAASQQLQTTANAADRPLLEAQVAELTARLAAVWEGPRPDDATLVARWSRSN